MNILIKNGRLIDPAAGIDQITDILVENGKIVRIAPAMSPGGAEVLDAKNLVVSPGFIDIHVHLREPGQEYKETIASGSAAAVRGGFTSIACMPNTSPVNDKPSITKYILSKAAEAGLVNVFPVPAISLGSTGKELVNMEELVQAGARGFSDDGCCVMDPQLFREALKTAKQLNVPVIEHPEDHSSTGTGQLNEGVVSRKYGLKGMPAAAEDSIVARDIQLQREIGGKLHLTHLSTAGAVKLVKKAKRSPAHNRAVTADATPHHLLLTEDLIAENKDPVYKMKPPLRTEKDRLALVKAIKTGVIDCIATDHAPHSREEKKRPFEEAPYGVIGMETAFSVIYDRLVRTRIIDMQRLIQLFSTNPAGILGLEDRGRVAQGFPADLTLLDLNRDFVIKAEDFYSKAVNCPFIGWQGKGVIAYTIVNGCVVFSS